MNQNSGNFSLSIPQKLHLYQVIAYLESKEADKAMLRIREVLKAAREPETVDQTYNGMLQRFTFDEIVRAAASVLLAENTEKAA